MGYSETRSRKALTKDISVRTPYLAMPINTDAIIELYNEDCIEGMKKYIENDSIDVAVTSPPYNIGVSYNTYVDNKPRREYLTWMDSVGEEIRRVLKEEGSFFLNVGSKPTDPWISLDIAQTMRKHFTLQNVIHWIKSIAIDKNDVGKYPNIKGDVAVGHYKPIGGERFLHDCHEYIFHFTKAGRVPLERKAIGVPYQDKSNIKRWRSAKEDKRCRGNNWFIPYETIWNSKDQRPHPSTFPVRLPEMCILLHGLQKTEVVLDPFMGLGSTALACMNLGVSCIGFEIDTEYLGVARERLLSFSGGRGSLPNKGKRVKEDSDSQIRLFLGGI